MAVQLQNSIGQSTGKFCMTVSGWYHPVMSMPHDIYAKDVSKVIPFIIIISRSICNMQEKWFIQ